MTPGDMSSMNGKVAMVVGATGAIGSETARTFAAAGARVVLAGRNAEKGERLLAEIQQGGGDAIFVPCDVTDPAAMEQVMAQTVDRFGRLDAAFNNAGWEGTEVEAADIREEDWQRMMDVKLTGTWRALKAQVRQFLAQGGPGAIVNMSGSWGLVGAPPRYSSYCAAAHGIMGLTRSSAAEYAGRGIRINAVCPGAVDTPMFGRMTDDDAAILASVASTIPMGRLARPADIAQAVLWLCSDQAGYITGQGIPLTGGAQ